MLLIDFSTTFLNTIVTYYYTLLSCTRYISKALLEVAYLATVTIIWNILNIRTNSGEVKTNKLQKCLS